MKKTIKKIIKTFSKKIDLLKNLKMSLLNFNLAMIYIIHKMLVFLKSHLNFLKAVFLNAF